MHEGTGLFYVIVSFFFFFLSIIGRLLSLHCFTAKRFPVSPKSLSSFDPPWCVGQVRPSNKDYALLFNISSDAIEYFFFFDFLHKQVSNTLPDDIISLFFCFLSINLFYRNRSAYGFNPYGNEDLGPNSFLTIIFVGIKSLFRRTRYEPYATTCDRLVIDA